LRFPTAGRERDAAAAAQLVARWRRVPLGAGTQAYLALFDAFVFRRERRRRRMRAAAADAAARFAACGWPRMERVAAALRDDVVLPSALLVAASEERTQRRPRPLQLTQRERDIVLLVLEGMKNREIARRLAQHARVSSTFLKAVSMRLSPRAVAMAVSAMAARALSYYTSERMLTRLSL
jgi:flagellar motility protein MotE (MotC chaperone)